MNDAVLPMALEAAGRFQWKGEAEKVSRYGSGHINDTYLVQTKGAGRYILQRISPAAFREPLKLMENIERVTSYLAGAIGRRGGDPLRETLTLVPTLDGRACWQDGQGHIWRAYLFIEHTRSYQLPESARLMYEAGLAFGAFQRELDGFPAETLYEVIPRFHDTPDRMKRLEGAAEKNPAGRLHQVEKELDFCRRRAEKAAELNRLLKQGELPVRVTHNDTKLNNVLFDAASLRGLCVIDLDTVMPGLCAYDFGDAIRFGANTALEDEKDLSKVRFSLPMFQAYLKGYLESAGEILTGLEKETLPLGAWTMTLECGARFLTDYLEGDRYFHIAYPEHNLHRAKNQFKLAAEMEAAWEEMARAVKEAEQ